MNMTFAFSCAVIFTISSYPIFAENSKNNIIDPTNTTSESVAPTNQIYNSVALGGNVINVCASEWNFIAEARNLTEKEKDFYREMANIFEKVDRKVIDEIAIRVKILDQMREENKINGGFTNINWTSFSDFKSNDGITLGLREDGVVVWRKK